MGSLRLACASRAFCLTAAVSWPGKSPPSRAPVSAIIRRFSSDGSKPASSRNSLSCSRSMAALLANCGAGSGRWSSRAAATAAAASATRKASWSVVRREVTALLKCVSPAEVFDDAPRVHDRLLVEHQDRDPLLARQLLDL